MSTYALKRIWKTERLRCSVNGNPRFCVYFEDDTTRGYRTSSDHGFCYEIGNPNMRDGSLVYVQLTRAGLVSDMRPPTREQLAALNESGGAESWEEAAPRAGKRRRRELGRGGAESWEEAAS